MVKKIRPVYRRMVQQRAASLQEKAAAPAPAVKSSESPAEAPSAKPSRKSNSKSS